MGKFSVFSIGLLVSVLGSAFTGLALGVWVFQETGSATLYGVTLLVNLLPGVLFGPIAGALVDRYNRRVLLIASDSVAAATVVALALVYRADALAPWHIFIVVGIQSLVRAVQMPALSSSVILLAPRDQVGRANGLVMLAQALGNTVGFAAGGVLLVTIGLDGVLFVDFSTFVVNVVILSLIRIPKPERSEAGSAGGGSLMSEIRVGWRVLASRRALVTLLIFGAALNLSLGYADAMLTPLVLSFASAAALGLVIAAMGVGAVVGSLSLVSWGGPRRRINGLAGFALPLGLFLILGAVRPSVPLIVIAALGFTICFTIMDGTSRNILQLEVEPDVQGRVFSAYNMVGGAVLAVSYLLAGPIADRVFEPLLQPGGGLAGSVGSVIGTGPGRGMALSMLLIGGVMLLTAVLAYLQPSLRNLPDRPTGTGRRTDAEMPEVEQLPVPGEPLVVPIPDEHDGTTRDRPVRVAGGGSDDVS